MAKINQVEWHYEADGMQKDFAVPFIYINPADVEVHLDGVPTLNFSLQSSGYVRFSTAPDAGVQVSVLRSTDARNPLHVFQQGSPMLPQPLDENFRQVLYAVEEGVSSAEIAVDSGKQALSIAEQADQKADTAISTAESAESLAQSADSTATSALSTAGTAVSTAGTALSTANSAASTAGAAAQDAVAAVQAANSAVQTALNAEVSAQDALDVTEGYADDINQATSAALAAGVAATDATNAANAAVAAVSAIEGTANQAASDASTALSTAQGIAGTAQDAADTANQAVVAASNALSTAQGIEGTAQDAANTANQAASDASTALSTANTALTTAGNALSTAQNAVADAAAAGTKADTAISDINVLSKQGAAAWSASEVPYPVNAQVYRNGKQWLALRANSVAPVEGTNWTELVGKQSLPWVSRAVGEEIWLDDSNTAVQVPPTDDSSFRFIKLTAGETGIGGYNRGVLTNESVSGSAPLIEATAKVNLQGSPFHGKTVRLLNTERRFVRAGSAGELQDDQMQQITGEITSMSTTWSNRSGALYLKDTGVYTSSGTNTGGAWKGLGFDSSRSPDARTGNENRPRNVGRTIYMRIL